jgi:hypothetical protein
MPLTFISYTCVHGLDNVMSTLLAHTAGHLAGWLHRYGLSLAALSRWDEAVQHYATVAAIVAQWPLEYRVMPERVLGASLAKILKDRRAAERRDIELRGAAGGGNGGGGGGDSDSIGGGGGSGGGGDNSGDGGGNSSGGGGSGDGEAAAVTQLSVEDRGNGGWPRATLGTHESSRCNIDRRPGLSKADFIREYVAATTPSAHLESLRLYDLFAFAFAF